MNHCACASCQTVVGVARERDQQRERRQRLARFLRDEQNETRRLRRVLNDKNAALAQVLGDCHELTMAVQLFPERTIDGRRANYRERLEAAADELARSRGNATAHRAVELYRAMKREVVELQGLLAAMTLERDIAVFECRRAILALHERPKRPRG